jgi:hypothetical protein
MKSWRIVSGVSLMLWAVGASLAADPEEELRDAVDRLWAAGNYSWEQGHDTSSDGRKTLPSRTFNRGANDAGQTNIGGFTATKTRRHQFVFNENEIAILFDGRWRHVDDLTLSDREKLAGYRPGAVGERNIPTYSSIRALPHEVLRALLGSAKNFRKEGPAIVADLGSPFNDQLHFIGYLGNRKKDPLPFRRGAPLVGGKAELVVWLDRGITTEFTVEFNSTLPNWFFVKLAKIGTTKVEIDPEAEALFLGRRAKP